MALKALVDSSDYFEGQVHPKPMSARSWWDSWCDHLASPSAANLWHQTCYVFPNCNEGTVQLLQRERKDEMVTGLKESPNLTGQTTTNLETQAQSTWTSRSAFLALWGGNVTPVSWEYSLLAVSAGTSFLQLPTAEPCSSAEWRSLPAALWLGLWLCSLLEAASSFKT